MHLKHHEVNNLFWLYSMILFIGYNREIRCANRSIWVIWLPKSHFNVGTWQKKQNLKDMNYLRNIANNKTHRAQWMPPPGHIRTWYIIKFILWEINNLECRSVNRNWLYVQVRQWGELSLNKALDKCSDRFHFQLAL